MPFPSWRLNEFSLRTSLSRLRSSSRRVMLLVTRVLHRGGINSHLTASLLPQIS